MLSHLRGLLAFSFSLKVVRRPAIAELNPLAAFSENGTVKDVSPIWNVIGAVAAQTKTFNSSPKITDLYALRHSKLPPPKELKWA